MKNFVVIGNNSKESLKFIYSLIINLLDNSKKDEQFGFVKQGDIEGDDYFQNCVEQIKRYKNTVWSCIGKNEMLSDQQAELGDVNGFRFIKISQPESLAELITLANSQRKHYLMPDGVIVVVPYLQDLYDTTQSENLYDMVGLCDFFGLSNLLFVITWVDTPPTADHINELKKLIESSGANVDSILVAKTIIEPHAPDISNRIKLMLHKEDNSVENEVARMLVAAVGDQKEQHCKRGFAREIVCSQQTVTAKVLEPPYGDFNKIESKRCQILPGHFVGEVKSRQLIPERTNAPHDLSLSKNWLFQIKVEVGENICDAIRADGNGSAVPIIGFDDNRVFHAKEIVAEVAFVNREKHLSEGMRCIVASAANNERAIIKYKNKRIFRPYEPDKARNDRAFISIGLDEPGRHMLCDLYERDPFLGSFILRSAEDHRFLGAGKIRFIPDAEENTNCCPSATTTCGRLFSDKVLQNPKMNYREIGWNDVVQCIVNVHLNNEDGMTPQCLYHDKDERIKRAIEISQIMIAMENETAFHPANFLKLLSTQLDDQLKKKLIMHIKKILLQGYCRDNWLEGLRKTFDDNDQPALCVVLEYIVNGHVDESARRDLFFIVERVAELERYPAFYSDFILAVNFMECIGSLILATDDIYKKMLQRLAYWLTESEPNKKRIRAIELYLTIEKSVLSLIGHSEDQQFGQHYYAFENAVYGLTALSKDFYRDHINHVIRVILLSLSMVPLLGLNNNAKKAILCAALYHDAMVFISKLFSSLRELAERRDRWMPGTFSECHFPNPEFDNDNLEEYTLKINKIIKTKLGDNHIELMAITSSQMLKMNHAVLETFEFIRKFGGYIEETGYEYLGSALLAILFHDKEIRLHQNNSFISFPELTEAFILLLADELQEWDRAVQWPSDKKSFRSIGLPFTSLRNPLHEDEIVFLFKPDKQAEFTMSFDALVKRVKNLKKLKADGLPKTIIIRYDLGEGLKSIFKPIRDAQVLDNNLFLRESGLDSTAQYSVWHNNTLKNEVVYIKTIQTNLIEKINQINITIGSGGVTLHFCDTDIGMNYLISDLGIKTCDLVKTYRLYTSIKADLGDEGKIKIIELSL